jgi:dimethylhistidine N-methyltransferase
MIAPVRRAYRGAFANAVRDEVLAGLLASVKSLPPKLFYDARGSALFEQICDQHEYYLTRAEMEILERRAPELAELAGPRCALIEYGSGAGVKVRLLLDAFMRPTLYSPIDVSLAQLSHVSERLAGEYPGVAVRPVCADYSRGFELPGDPPLTRRRIGFFPGSSIGNFHPTEAAAFLHRARHVLGENGAMVLGVDSLKPASVLNAAYNDAGGVTAAFNLNILARLNRELGANFEPAHFRHLAFFNAKAGRVEMHLESLREQVASVAGTNIEFARGETIWTESSYKYDRDGLEDLVTSAGFALRRAWTDGGDRFWVAFLAT